jgi:hypothetical protein
MHGIIVGQRAPPYDGESNEARPGGSGMFRNPIIAIVAILAFSSPALAQLPLPLPIPPILPMPEGTPEDRAACHGDVQRYCQSAIPDNMRVLACLQQNRQRIGPACRGVLEKYGQ